MMVELDGLFSTPDRGGSRWYGKRGVGSLVQELERERGEHNEFYTSVGGSEDVDQEGVCQEWHAHGHHNHIFPGQH